MPIYILEQQMHCTTIFLHDSIWRQQVMTPNNRVATVWYKTRQSTCYSNNEKSSLSWYYTIL